MIAVDLKNSLFMYLLGGFVGLFVIAQSLFFLLKAIKRSKELGIDGGKVRKTIVSSAIFAILPSISILLGLITLSYSLGLPLPWIRLSVIGAVTYELPAATAALNALGESITSPVSSTTAFSAVAWVMTLGCISPLVIIPLFLKKILGGVGKIRTRDSHWGDLFLAAMFLGMIAAFLGMGVSGGVLSVLTLLSSAALMVIFGLFVKIKHVKWLEDFALPLSMLGAMALTVLYANILPQQWL